MAHIDIAEGNYVFSSQVANMRCRLTGDAHKGYVQAASRCLLAIGLSGHKAGQHHESGPKGGPLEKISTVNVSSVHVFILFDDWVL
jgi:hypothetical protein